MIQQTMRNPTSTMMITKRRETEAHAGADACALLLSGGKVCTYQVGAQRGGALHAGGRGAEMEANHAITPSEFLLCKQ
jgi:hypothetical protein